MDRQTLLQVPAVAALVASAQFQNSSASDQDAILTLLQATTAAAAQTGAVETQRTAARRDMGVPHQQYKNWQAYYSVVRFSGTVVTVAGPPATTTVTWTGGTELKPFSYKIGDPLVSAGFPAAFGPGALATPADTNLVKASETLGGEQLKVHGVSLMPSLTTDTGAWSFLNDSMSVSLTWDGDQRKQRLGRPFMIPASGGNYGFPTSIVTPFAMGSWSNGVPDIMNFYPFPEPVLWTSSGQTDSNFNLLLRLERTVAITAPTASTSPVTSGIDVGAYVDYMARLHTSQTADRSLNS
jgi:hypothetical protein